MNPDWLIPDWPAPPHVKAVFTSRGISRNDVISKSGVSQPPFDAFNLGDHVGDDPTHVMANRHMLQVLIGAKPVYLKQVHGTEVVTLTAQNTAWHSGRRLHHHREKAGLHHHGGRLFTCAFYGYGRPIRRRCARWLAWFGRWCVASKYSSQLVL